uniref:Cyclin N-terminal domain-containing protein n=1 Tax=Panagrolaimus superbus TaxID=310955 RepID=A0A914Y2I5_9BILA
MDLIKILSSDAITPVKLLFCAACMYFSTVPHSIEKYSKRIKLVTIAAEVMLVTRSYHLIEELRDSYEYFLGPLSFHRSSCQFFSENCRWEMKPDFSLQKVEKKRADLKISFEAAEMLYIYGNHDDVDHFISVLESFADHVREDKVTFPEAFHRHVKHISSSKSGEKNDMSEAETASSAISQPSREKVPNPPSTSKSEAKGEMSKTEEVLSEIS